MLANEELVHVAQVQAQAAQTQLQVATDKLRAGAGVRSDSLSAAVAYGNAQVALLTAQANLAGAQVTLGRQVGINGPVRAVADSGIPVFPDPDGDPGDADWLHAAGRRRRCPGPRGWVIRYGEQVAVLADVQQCRVLERLRRISKLRGSAPGTYVGTTGPTASP